MEPFTNDETESDIEDIEENIVSFSIFSMLNYRDFNTSTKF